MENKYCKPNFAEFEIEKFFLITAKIFTQTQ